MPELEIRHAEAGRLNIVQLRVQMTRAVEAAARMTLPGRLQSLHADDHVVLWTAPDQWLFIAERAPAASLIDRCSHSLTGLLHLAVDVSASLHRVSIAGPRGRELLAMGSGLDWAAESTPAGFASRTRLARIPTIVHVVTTHSIDVYVDRSHRDYFERWIERSSCDPLLRATSCRNTY